MSDLKDELKKIYLDFVIPEVTEKKRPVPKWFKKVAIQSKRKRKAQYMITIANLIANFFIFSLSLLMFIIASFIIYIVVSEWIGDRKWR